MVRRLPGISGPEGKVEVQTLPSGDGCGPEGRLRPGQADANMEEAEQGIEASCRQGLRTVDKAGWKSGKEADSPVHMSDG